MPSAPYASLPTKPSSDDEAIREMEDAFGDEDDEDVSDDYESTPLNRQYLQQPNTHNRSPAIEVPASYDFERDYDYTLPPPGSPPQPSATALPNDYGNSNGLIPNTTPVAIVRERGSPSFFRRAVGVLLPTHYQRIDTAPPSAGVIGGGVENDGVFANVMAKPVGGARSIRAEDGSIYLAPEETQKELPPTYAEAQSDSVPGYWETTVVAPSGLGESGDMIVDDLPTGSVFIFAFNLFTSFFFQFLGFVITYFLSTTHAAKYGSRAGLGLTFIQYGAYWRVATSGPAGGGGGGAQEIAQDMISWNKTEWGWQPVVSNTTAFEGVINSANTTAPEPSPDYGFGWNGKDWVALALMTLGWLLLFSSIVSYWRVKRWEMSIRASSQPAQPIAEEAVQRDLQTRHNIGLIFGFGFVEDNEVQTEGNEGDIRLARHLRAAGLI